MGSSTKILLVLGVFCLFTYAQNAGAVMIGLSTEALTRESELVVEGTVKQVRSYWNADKTKIMSAATLAVIETVRGEGNRQTLTVEWEGGEVGDIGMGVSDSRPLVKGERVLLFLKAGQSSEADGPQVVVGMAQGVYAVGQDHIARKSGFSLVPGGEAVDSDIDIDLLKEKIRSIR